MNGNPGRPPPKGERGHASKSRRHLQLLRVLDAADLPWNLRQRQPGAVDSCPRLNIAFPTEVNQNLAGKWCRPNQPPLTH